MEEVTSADPPIYRDLMRFKPEEWTANAWAVNAGVSRTVWTDMRRHGNPSRRTLEKLLVAAGSSLAEFEALRIGDDAARPDGGGASLSDRAQPWRPAQSPLLPLISSRAAATVNIGGQPVEAVELDAGKILDRLHRPAALSDDPGAYAFTIVGKTMWPRFRQNRRVAVSPAASVFAGDDVVVTISKDLASGSAIAVLGELVTQTGGQVQFRQFNPDGVIRIDADRVVALHKIVGELI